MPDHSDNNLRLLALDVGAESGRAILGAFNGHSLQLEEVHRFSNGPVRVNGHFYTDILSIWEQIQIGVRKGYAASRSHLNGMGVDTWGVDYALLDRNDQLLGNPYHYRDHRTNGIEDQLHSVVSQEQVYFQTGNQFMPFNTLYQLYAMRQQEPQLLDLASSLLMLPDLLHYWLSGVKTSEFCVATTTQCFDQKNNQWAEGLLDKLRIPISIFQEISLPGTVLGNIHPWILPSASQHCIPVILPASHDTGSAVVAVPAENKDFLYVSSGTWSLVGTELDEPVITLKSMQKNLTNEGNPSSRTRFLKIVPGMWLLQQCKQAWNDAGRNYNYDQLTGMASDVKECGPIIDISSPEFFDPGGMPARIQAFCHRSGQPVPQTDGEIARCILESLAYLYRSLLEDFQDVLGKKLEIIHIIGGGSRNFLLNQIAANVTKQTVVAGPVEATAAGNVLVQAMGLGELSSIDDIRAVVRRSFDPKAFTPVFSEAWEEGYQRYRIIVRNNPIQ
ncbi:MAG: rhamnulokinase [Anaerolinea sp.]|nr:rhamnulokinase [Anaerolinea sp.]